MYQTMEIHMARKKQVPGHYNPDSYRIFDTKVGDESVGNSRLNKLHTEKKRDPPPPHPREPERRNCPHPWHSRFLRHNVRFLNEPMCLVATEATDAEQTDWWPSRTSKEPLKVPPRSENTVQRSDFQPSAPVPGNTRHSSNPFTAASKGILPVNVPKRKEDPGDTLLEKISFNNNYNSRTERNEPIRGKLHGSFVWDELAATDRGHVVVTPWNKRHIHRCVTVPVTKQEQDEVKGHKKSSFKDSTKNPGKAATTRKPSKNGSTQKPTATPLIKKPDESSQEGNAATNKKETLPPIDGLPAPSA